MECHSHRQHLFTHVSVPFIHNPRYLNLLPPHPGKLLSASSCVANVFLFPFAFFAQRSGPSKLFFCFCLFVVVIVSCEKKRETKHQGCAITGRQLAQGPACARAAEKEINWFVLVCLCLCRRFQKAGINATGTGADWVN